MRNRLFSICPYFAMFPESFVGASLEAFTKKNDFVFDPFCGRGTTILQSLLMDRNAAGTDTNPVAYCLSRAKASPPSLGLVNTRIDALERSFSRSNHEALVRQRKSLPRFFHYAYRPETLKALLFLRGALRWRTNETDCFVAALVLGALHGEMDKSSSYLSNQMPRTISTKPKYSINYWRKHHLLPPRRHIFHLLREKAAYRFMTGVPRVKGLVSLGDARDSADLFNQLEGRVKAIITSPPYLNVTRYEEDQWLRLWFLGHDPRPTYNSISPDDRHASPSNYWEFLLESWEGVAPLTTKSAVLVCRLAAKNVSRLELTENLLDTIVSVFPKAYMIGKPVISKIRNRQTRYFRPGSSGCFFEIDYSFKLS